MSWINRAVQSTGEFLLGDGWERPRPAWAWRDAVVPLVALVLLTFGFELLRSFADFTGARPIWVEYLMIVSACVLLVFRRRYPLSTGLIAGLHFGIAITWVGEIGYLLVYQVVIFFVLYSMVAWARNRRLMVAAAITLFALLMLWLAWAFALGNALQSYYGSDARAHGLFGKITAVVLYSFLSNLLYFFGATLMGQIAWREARDKSRLVDQSVLLAEQAEQLAEQAVVTERLRLARELHDVVAHHVSLMGVQAAGARRVLTKDPELAAEALSTVEQSSREAVTQMRHLLGTLRGPAHAEDGLVDRSPEPSLAELPELVRSANADGLMVELQVATDQHLVDQVARPVQLSLYRVVQEALTNIRRHSTARSARVVVRGSTQDGWVEVEVVDDGRPRVGTSGSGLGQLGMRERVSSHGGSAEIGPRATGGYRVRVRFPLGGASMRHDGSRD